MSLRSRRTSRGTSRPSSAMSAVSIVRANSLVTQRSISCPASACPSRRASSRPFSVSATAVFGSPFIRCLTLYSLSPWRARMTESGNAEQLRRIVRHEHAHLALSHTRFEQPRADLAERVSGKRISCLPEIAAERRALRPDPADPVDEHVDVPVVERRLLVVHAPRGLDQRDEL